MKVKKLFVILLALAMCFAFFGCGGGGDAPADTPAQGDTPAPADTPPVGDIPTSVKIGIPNPTSGVIAAFGIGTPWAEELAIATINEAGGIYFEDYDATIPIELIIVDTESDITTASEVTQQLIEKDDVDLLLARHSPETSLPVSAMAERYKVPCISLECPIEPWVEGGPYEWVYHSFWKTETCLEVYMQMWQDLGYGEGTVVGYLFPNDANTPSWKAITTAICEEHGYVISDPGIYPILNSEWTNVISQFKADGVKIITGNDINPNVVSFLTQAKSAGLAFEMVTVGRCFLFPADINALDMSLAEGVTCEVWWGPWNPYASSLTGQTCQELCDLYEEETGLPWSAPMGYKYAAIELAVDVLTRAPSLEPEDIVAAIAATNTDTVVGHIQYDQATHTSGVSITGGQWVANEAGDAVELQVVSNALYPEVPVTAEIFKPNY